MKKAIFALATILLSSCSVTYQAAGKYDDGSDKFTGEVVADLLTGGGSVTLVSKSNGAKCSGDAILTKAGVTCAGQGGTMKLNCDDGRVLKGLWETTSCTTGYGKGTDSTGKSFEFIFGLTEEEAENAVK